MCLIGVPEGNEGRRETMADTFPEPMKYMNLYRKHMYIRGLLHVSETA